jgi:putative ABC transport system permease protein
VEAWDRQLPLGQAVAGANLTWQVGEKANLLGYNFTVSNRLEPTGTEVDQTVFMSYETAREFFQVSGFDSGFDPSYIPNRASGILVRVDQSSQTEVVFDRVLQNVPRTRLLRSTDMLQAQRGQLVGLLWTGIWLLALVTLLSMVIVGLLFSITVNERRQELGVLKAIGFTRQAIIQTILFEGGVLAVLGGGAGAVLAVAGVLTLGGALQNLLGMSISLPAWQEVLRNTLGGLAFSLVSIGLATLVPALRITGQETAIIMREE